MGRAAQAAPPLCTTDLRLHPSRLLALGRGLRHRALRDRQPRRERAAAALVGTDATSLARAHRAASARVRRGDARATHRTARVDRRTASRPRSAARASRARQSTRRDFRRGAAADRSRTRDARAHDRADRERHGDAVGARNGLGARACAAFSRRAARARRRRHRGLPRREAAAHVGRRGAVARHGFLYCVRGLARRRLRLVDVPRLRSRRLHPLRARRSARRAREPHGDLQRVSAPPAVGGRVDRRAGARASHRRGARAAPEEHEALGDRPALHRARARGGRHSRVARRGGRRRRARLGRGGGTPGRGRLPRRAGAANDDGNLARVAPGLATAVRRHADRHVFAATVESRLLAAACRRSRRTSA